MGEVEDGAKEAKLGNMGGGHEGENKDEELRTGRQPVLSGGDRQEINLPVALWLCVFLYNVREEKRKENRQVMFRNKGINRSSFKVFFFHFGATKRWNLLNYE